MIFFEKNIVIGIPLLLRGPERELLSSEFAHPLIFEDVITELIALSAKALMGLFLFEWESIM